MQLCKRGIAYKLHSFTRIKEYKRELFVKCKQISTKSSIDLSPCFIKKCLVSSVRATDIIISYCFERKGGKKITAHNVQTYLITQYKKSQDSSNVWLKWFQRWTENQTKQKTSIWWYKIWYCAYCDLKLTSYRILYFIPSVMFHIDKVWIIHLHRELISGSELALWKHSSIIISACYHNYTKLILHTDSITFNQIL